MTSPNPKSTTNDDDLLRAPPTADTLYPPPPPTAQTIESLASTSHRDSFTLVNHSPSQSESHQHQQAQQPQEQQQEKKLSDEELYPENLRAYLVLLGCFIIAAVVMGFSLCWGVFQAYYLDTPRYALVSPSLMSFVGAIQGGVPSLCSIIAGRLGDTYGYKRFLALSSLCMFLSLFLAAFSTQLWEVFLTQGVLGGLALGIAFPFIVAYPSQWFLKRRALAMSIVIAGSSLGAAITSQILRALLSHLTLRNTLIIYSFINLALMGIAMGLVTEGPSARLSRPKESRNSWKSRWSGRGEKILETREKAPVRRGQGGFNLGNVGGLMRRVEFVGLAMSVALCVFGFLVPYFYITLYTQTLHPTLPLSLTVLPLTLTNIFSTTGRILVGLLSDRYGPTNMYILTTLVGGLSQLLLWNFAANKSYAGILVFSSVFGAFGGCFLSLMGPVAVRLVGVGEVATTVGLLNLFLTPGMLAGGPLAGAIQANTPNGRWKWVGAISFSGGIQLASLVPIVYVRLRREPRLLGRI